LKDLELKLIAELSKNSRRSDRELAKRISTSQPTVTRMRTRLEKEGIIREYTIIPDFAKLGYQIASIVFAKLREPPTEKTVDELLKQVRGMEKKNPSPTIVSMRGIGCSADYVSVAFHKTYSEYTRYVEFIKNIPQVKIDDVKSFIISLTDQGHFRCLTLSVLANYLLRTEQTR
jgi:DNA-binding Lrp family transcriptional regulator